MKNTHANVRTYFGRHNEMTNFCSRFNVFSLKISQMLLFSEKLMTKTQQEWFEHIYFANHKYEISQMKLWNIWLVLHQKRLYINKNHINMTMYTGKHVMDSSLRKSFVYIR